MAIYIIQESTLVDIADSIRSRTGSTAPIAVVDMAEQIKSISGGGTNDYLLADDLYF